MHNDDAPQLVHRPPSPRSVADDVEGHGEQIFVLEGAGASDGIEEGTYGENGTHNFGELLLEAESPQPPFVNTRQEVIRVSSTSNTHREELEDRDDGIDDSKRHNQDGDNMLFSSSRNISSNIQHSTSTEHRIDAEHPSTTAHIIAVNKYHGSDIDEDNISSASSAHGASHAQDFTLDLPSDANEKPTSQTHTSPHTLTAHQDDDPHISDDKASALVDSASSVREDAHSVKKNFTLNLDLDEAAIAEHEREQGTSDKKSMGVQTGDADDGHRAYGRDAGGGGGGGGGDEPPPRGKDGDEDSVEGEVQHIPYNNMKIVYPGLLLTAFLAALDQTIAAVALPTIIDDIGGASGYAWVGTAYLLTTACLSPVYGKAADLVDRKALMLFAIAMFLFGSALCGAAQNFTWLVIARGVQGIGGAGVTQIVQTTLADITTLKERGKYAGGLGAIFGIASVLGPLVGGALTQHVSWRWCFFINLPTGGAAFVLLLVSLHLNPVPRRPFRQVVATFDFIGLALIIAATVLLLVGFQQAGGAAGWGDPVAIGTVAGGAVAAVLSIVYEIHIGRARRASGTFIKASANTNANGKSTHGRRLEDAERGSNSSANSRMRKAGRDAILPRRLLTTRTPALMLVAVFLHGMLFLGSAYYVPLYFQILGSSPTNSGLRQIPMSIGTAIFGILSGGVVSKTGRYREVMWSGAAVMVLGFGLMSMLDERTRTAVQEVLIFVPSIGIGFFIMPPLIALQASMPFRDTSVTVAAYNLVRILGGTLGISVGDTIFAGELHKRLARIPGIAAAASSGASASGGLSNDLGGLARIPDLTLRGEVLHAYTRSLSLIWVVYAPIAGVALICSFFVKAYNLDRNVVRGSRGGATASAEVGEDASPAVELQERGEKVRPIGGEAV